MKLLLPFEKLRDCQAFRDDGLSISCASNEAIKLFDAALHQYIGWYEAEEYGGLARTCGKMMESDPDFVMGKILLIAIDLIATGTSIKTNPELSRNVNDLVNRLNGKYTTEMENLHIRALKLFADGYWSDATDVYEEILIDYPKDVLATKLVHDTYFYLGKQNQIRDSVLRILPHYKENNPFYGYLHGMLSFGLEETNMYDKAEKTAKLSDYMCSDVLAVPFYTNSIKFILRLKKKQITYWFENTSPMENLAFLHNDFQLFKNIEMTEPMIRLIYPLTLKHHLTRRQGFQTLCAMRDIRTLFQALQLNKHDAWATHTIAHVYESDGRFEDGIKFLRNFETDWNVCDMLACHLYWHWGVYLIEKGQYDEVLEMFDQQIGRRAHSGAMLDFVDSASLLYRLGLEGVKVGDRWKSVSEIAQTHLNDQIMFFNDMHFSIAFLGNKRNDLYETLVGNIKKILQTSRKGKKETSYKETKRLNLNICDSFLAFEEKNYEKVVELLYPEKDKFVTIGGSNAQRDLLNQLLVQSCIRSKNSRHNHLAQNLINERKGLKPDSPLTDRLMAKLLSSHRVLDINGFY